MTWSSWTASLGVISEDARRHDALERATPDAPNHTDDGARVSRRLPGAVVDGGSLVHSAGRQLVATLPQQVVLVTHHLELLEGFDRVLVFDEARLVCDDSPEPAIGFYRKLMS